MINVPEYKNRVNKTINHVKGNIDTLYNIGVGPRPHCEAAVFKERFPNIDTYGFEPNPNIYADRYKSYEGTILPIGVWSEPCFQTITIQVNNSRLADQSGSTLLTPDPAWLKEKGHQIIDKRKIYCVTIDMLDKDIGSPDNIFIWVDIEGSELYALKGAETCLKEGRVKGIDLEVSHSFRRIGEPTEKDLTDYLSPFGFKKVEEYGRTSTFHNSVYILS